jgi:NAD(P)-dependent dehydrogenase (short-subunit alcohol dehydrogenase family)
MIQAGWGRIINVTSAASLHPPGPRNSAYSVSKVAVNQMTRCLAVELAGTGVTANLIHPGEVKTAMWSDIREQIAALGPVDHPLRDWVAQVERTGGDPPEKAADLVLRLVADDAGGTSGGFFWIEGGQQTPIETSWA